MWDLLQLQIASVLNCMWATTCSMYAETADRLRLCEQWPLTFIIIAYILLLNWIKQCCSTILTASSPRSFGVHQRLRWNSREELKWALNEWWRQGPIWKSLGSDKFMVRVSSLLRCAIGLYRLHAKCDRLAHFSWTMSDNGTNQKESFYFVGFLYFPRHCAASRNAIFCRKGQFMVQSPYLLETVIALFPKLVIQ